MGARAAIALVVTLLVVGCGAEASPREPPAPQGPYDVGVAGAHRSYEGTRASADVVRSALIVSASSGGFVRQVVTSFPATGGSERELITYSVEGGSEYLVKTERSTPGSDIVTTRIYVPPMLVLPADDTPGHVETSASTVTVENTGMWPLTCEATREVAVVGFETIVVPAGTFRALKTTAHEATSCGTPGSSSTESDGVTWWAPGIGAVKFASQPSGAPDLGETYLLTGYGVAAGF